MSEKKNGWKLQTVLCIIGVPLLAYRWGWLYGDNLQAALHCVGMVLLGLLAIALYLLPTIIAYERGARGRLMTCFINCWAGWTLIGWFVALFLATYGPSDRPQQVVIVERKPA